MAEGVDLPNDGFGGKNTLSLDGDVAAVGAPGAESVFLYHRTSAGTAATERDGVVGWTWGESPAEKLMSSDFDYDVVHLLKIVHRQVGLGGESKHGVVRGRSIGDRERERTNYPWPFWPHCHGFTQQRCLPCA